MPLMMISKNKERSIMQNSNYVELTIEDLASFSKLTGIKIAEDRVKNTLNDVNRINQSFSEVDISVLGNTDPAFTLKL